MFSISIKKTVKVSYVLFYCLEITTVNCLRLKKHFLICMISLITCTFYSWFLILHLILFFPFRNIHHYSILGEVIFNECTTRPDVSKRYPIVYFQTQFSHSISSPFLGAFPLWIVTPNIWDSSLPVLFLLYPHSVHQEIMLARPIYSGSFLLRPPWSILHRVWDVPSLPRWHSQLCSMSNCSNKNSCLFSLRILR